MNEKLKKYYDEFAIDCRLEAKALLLAIDDERRRWQLVENKVDDKDVKAIVAQKIYKLDDFKKAVESKLPAGEGEESGKNSRKFNRNILFVVMFVILFMLVVVFFMRSSLRTNLQQSVLLAEDSPRVLQDTARIVESDKVSTETHHSGSDTVSVVVTTEQQMQPVVTPLLPSMLPTLTPPSVNSKQPATVQSTQSVAITTHSSMTMRSSTSIPLTNVERPNQQDLQVAIVELEMQLLRDDKNLQIILKLADAYEATNRSKLAEEMLVRAKNLDGKNAVTRERLYKIYKDEGKRELAEVEIRELANLTKDNKHRIALIVNLVEGGKLDEAASVADEVTKSDPLNFDGLMAQASIQRMQRKFLDAIETYKRIGFLNNENAHAHAGRAEAHFAVMQHDRAEMHYKMALEIDPKMVSAELGLSRVYKAQKKRDLQRLHLDKALVLAPNNKAIQDELKQLNAAEMTEVESVENDSGSDY